MTSERTLDPNVWVTVAQAAPLMGRTERTIYLWIDDHKVTPRKNDDGLLIIRYGALLAAEAEIKRGRPRS